MVDIVEWVPFFYFFVCQSCIDKSCPFMKRLASPFHGATSRALICMKTFSPPHSFRAQEEEKEVFSAFSSGASLSANPTSLRETRRDPDKSWRGSCQIIEASGPFSSLREIHDSRDNRGNDNPEQLIPVKERDARQFWLPKVIEWRPAEGDKGNEEQKKQRLELSL
jgi:hypothetical protein